MIASSKMESAGNWSVIESNAGIFSALLRRFGVRGVHVEEMWLGDEYIENIRPIHGLIFFYTMFPDLQHDEPSNTVVTDPERLKTIYFAKQVNNNACATHAVINVLLNCNHSNVSLGPELSDLKDLSMPLDPQMRGETLTKCQRIRDAHDSVSRSIDNSNAIEMEEGSFRFIGYMPIHGRLYELDGLRDGPIDHGPIAPEQDWLIIVRPIIIRRSIIILRSYNGLINFNLMALVPDRKMVLGRRNKEALEDDTSMDEVENKIKKVENK